MLELSNLNYTENVSSIGFAGDTLNTAIYLKRLLGESAQVDYLTVLGRDPISDRLEKYMASEGIGTNPIRRVNNRTIGLYAIDNETGGERIFSYWRSQSAARLLFSDSDDFLKLRNYDWIYFSGISLAILSDTLRKKLLSFFENEKRSFQIAFDSNYRINLWEDKKKAEFNILRAFKSCNIGFPSLDDQMDLLNVDTESAVVRFFETSKIQQIVLKRGAKGPRLIGKVNENCKFPNLAKVVDTTAAGDSFNAGFLASYFFGKSVVDSTRYGHNLAKIVIKHRGAICPKVALHSMKLK